MARILIYTKDYCPFCHRAKALLSELRQDFEEIDIQQNPEKRDEMLSKSNGKTTVPQIFIGDKHIGGCDDLFEAHTQGTLTFE